MFETIIALFIKRYLARYFDINADQLSAQLLYKQQIIIENLTLNHTALNEDIQTKYKIPISIESFHIDKIQCSFVLSSLFFRSSSPALIVRIQGVHAVIKPAIIDDDDSSFTTSEENETSKKCNELNLAEQQLEKEFECFGEVKSSRWNVQRLLMSFCEKLQIEIMDVHISYQTSVLNAMGLTCESIHISNESSDETMSHQVLRVTRPGLYIDTNRSSVHAYILSLSTFMEVSLRHNHLLVSQKEYRYEFECSLSDLKMKCSVEQVRILADLIHSVQSSALRHMVLSDSSRPRAKITQQSAKTWWRYATLAILRTRVATTTNFWFDRSLFINRLHRLIIYQHLYRLDLNQKYFQCANFSSEDEVMMNEIETEFDLEHLLIVRRSIFQKRINEQLTQKKETVRWYSNYARWITTKMIDLWGKTSGVEETNTLLNENDVKLQEQVNTFIAESLEDEDLSESCQNALIFQLKFLLKSVQIDLFSSNNDLLFTFYLKNLSITTELRLRHRSILASASLQDLSIRDQRETDAFANILSSKETARQVPVFELSFEKKRRSKSSKQSICAISMRSCGLCIVCSPATMERLHDFYCSTFGSSPHTLSISFHNWKQIKNYAVGNLISIVERIVPTSTTSYLRHRHREKKKYQISVDIGAPKIVIPLSSQSALIVDLGSTILTNDVDNKDEIVPMVQENDEDEFVTPDSSPLTNDGPVEEETTYYSINVFPIEIESSSFSLSICDIQIEYSVDSSPIVEKFSIDFLVQHPSTRFWPFISISGIVQKMVLHLNPQSLRVSAESVSPWLSLINNCVTKQSYQLDTWPALDFHLDEIGVQLNDQLQALCDIRMQNIDLSLMNNQHSRELIFSLQTLTILDCLQHSETNADFILKTNQTSRRNDSFIRVNTDFSITSETQTRTLFVNIYADKLDFVFNPRTICALLNMLLDTKLYSSSQSVVAKFDTRTNSITCKINSTFRELHIFIIDITPMTTSAELHGQNVSLEISLTPFATVEVTMTAFQIFDLLSDPQRSTTVLMIDHQVGQSPALHLSLKSIEDGVPNLSLKVASVSCVQSPNIIGTAQRILDYMIKQVSNGEHHFACPLLSIDLNTFKVILPADMILQLSPIRIKNSSTRPSEYELHINRIEIRSNHITLPHQAVWQLLENISISVNLRISNASITINSKLISSLRIYLSPYRIKLLQQIIQTSLIRHTSSLLQVGFHLQSPEIVVIFQTDRNGELVTIGEATLNQYQMIYELDPPHSQRIALQLAFLRIKDPSINSDESLIALTSIELIDHQHEQIAIKLGTIDIRFVQSTWKILSQMIEIIGSSEIQAKKAHPIDISIDIDTISCLFQDDRTSLMNIDLQHFGGQLRTYSNASMTTSTIHGELGSISLHDLTTLDQFYTERVFTTGAKAIVFTFKIEEDHRTDLSVRSQLHLQLFSIQYIHTQSFFLSLLDYLHHFRALTTKPVIHQLKEQFAEILLNIEMENILLILPEHASRKPELIFHLGYFHLTTSSLNSITIRMKEIEFYSSSHCSLDEGSSSSIRFSNFGFSRPDNELSSMIRQPFQLNMEIERHPANAINQTSPIFIIKMNLSSLDVFLDFNHYQLIENILIHNLFASFPVLSDGGWADFACMMEIDHVSLEIFMLDTDLFSFDHRRSVGYAALTNLHLSFDQYTNGNQVIQLFCSTIELIDTRAQHAHMIIPLVISSDSKVSQLEFRLLRTKLDNQCTLTLNSMRFLVVIDWLLALNEFLHLFCERPNISAINISIPASEIQLNLNRFELALVSTTKDPYSNALVYSSTMVIGYKRGVRPFECSFTDLTFFTCQIGNIDETIVSIIEPTDCFVNIQASNEMPDEQSCELNIPMLNIRLSYSDLQMIYSLIQTISKQISQAKTRKPLLTFISAILTAPLRTLQAAAKGFLKIKFFKFISDQLCLCLIDDCFGVNIPLLNIHLKPFLLQTIENNRSNRTDRCEFDLKISYYNRFQSGFEPLIEKCPLQMTLTRSPSSTSLFLSSTETLNLNLTKAMYRLIGTIKTNWLADYRKEKKAVGFRRVKPVDPYCFKNLLGVRVKFRTWMIAEQRFSSFENTVDDKQIASFSFPTHSSQPDSQTRLRSNSVVTSLFQSDRRLSISIDGWKPFQPISIDRVGTFFRLAIPSSDQQSSKPILVILNIAMTDSSIRSITIRSSIEIRNQLLTSIDLKLTSQSNSSHEFCLEPNETRSLPIQFCSIFEQIQIRPTNFALDYCDQPINWSEIETNAPIEENAKLRQSFLRTCSIDGKEAVYYVSLQSKRSCLLTYSNQSLCIYQLTILSPLTIYNLLPCTLTFQFPSYPQKFQLNAYKTHREHTLNILENLDLLFATPLYRMTKPLHLPTLDDLHRTKHTYQRMIFYDQAQRELLVDVTTECVIRHRLKISVSVPYVFLNKTGIPLIFKDANSKVEAAGQSAEDESMLNREPFLFSFDHANRTGSCLMRVGTGLHRHQQGRPQWSQRFSIEPGSTHRQLQVRSPRSSSDWNYSIGIDVRPGHGQLKKINFIFLSARFIICNQCSYDLLIAQQPLKDDHSHHLHVSKHATAAFHWPRTDMEQLLCARLIDDHRYELVNWSCGFPVDCVNVFHINMRSGDGQCSILRVQVTVRNGTYFVVFMDANQMPPPFRISNQSHLPILFYQSEISEELTHLRTVIQPHQSMDYAWDEPSLKAMLTCSIVDGKKATYDLLKLGPGDDLNYENYIYLALEETFITENLIRSSDVVHSSPNSTSAQLVIEYVDDRLFLARRQEKRRSQLWHMASNGLLIHVESMTTSLDDIRQAIVLDVEDLADNSLSHLMARYSTLTVRQYDPKRALTQTWQLLDNGYLCLANTQMCVQVFGELKENKDIVLGPMPENASLLPPPTMHIRLHQRYQGAGVLSVRVVADGPTNVLQIDHKDSNELPIATAVVSPSSTLYNLDLHFPAGVGISVVGSIGHESEELIYLLVKNLHIQYSDRENERSVEAQIDTLIISNQILTTTKPCLLYATFTEDSPVKSAILLQINWQKFKNNFTFLHLIHSLHLNMNSITIQLDEVLFWKLIEFFDIEICSFSSLLFRAIGIGNTSNTSRRIDLNVNDYETERLLSLLTSTQTTRIYFNKLYLSSIDLNLSVYCIHSKRSLSPRLLAIKRRASFPLVPFENAQIHLKSYEQTHISNTYDFFLLSILTYYVNVGKRQALKIIGAADFLGNPLGLIHDVSDGITCLVDQRSVSGLVKNVAHGVADSTSKVTGSLSHGLGKLVSDHDRRPSATEHPRGVSIGHVIRHGTAGLAAGFYGGLTSMIKQPYKGAVEEGVPGLVKGFAKGIVGTVSKPMVGILDFTNEMAMVIREGSRSSNTPLHQRIRLTRCPCNTSGLLQSYSLFDAQGHHLLYKMKPRDSTERYISRLTLSTPQNNPTDQRNTDAMITTQRVLLYQIDDDSDASNFELLTSYDFHTPMTILPIESDDGSAYIEILPLNCKPSRRRCDTLEQALLFSREVQRAQDLFQEEKLIYISSDDDSEDFDE